MSSYWANTPYRQRVKPVASIPASPSPPTVKAPGGPLPQAPSFSAGLPGGGLPGGGMPSIPGYDPNVLAQAWGIINPQLQSAADIINRRSQMGSASISGLTAFLQGQMGQISGMVSNAYGPEIKNARNVANWAGASLTGAGAAQGAGLQNVLTQTGGAQGAIAGSADLNLAQEGKGAGGAAYGTGIAELDNLIASRAASQTRAALEPSFAAMTGQQQQSLLASQLARQLFESQSSIQATLPQLLSDLQDRTDTAARDTRDYTEKVREFNATLRADSATANAKAGSQADKDAYNYAKNTAAVFTKNGDHVYVPRRTKTGWQIFDAGPKTGGTTKSPTNTGPYFQDPVTKQWNLKPGYHMGPDGKTPVKDKTPAKPTQPTNTGPYYIDPNTKKPVLKPGYHIDPKTKKPVKDVTTTATGKVPTPGQTNTLVDTWYHGKTGPAKKVQRTDPKTGKPMWTAAGQPIYVQAPGQVTGQIGYQEAYKRLRAMNYSDQKARSYLDTNWKRGERGRPWVSGPERQALTKAKVRPSALFYRTFSKGKSIWHGYLNEAQRKALQAANLLPAGELVNGRYYIKPGLV